MNCAVSNYVARVFYATLTQCSVRQTSLVSAIMPSRFGTSASESTLPSEKKENGPKMESVQYRAPMVGSKERKLEQSLVDHLITPEVRTISEVFARHGAEIRIAGKMGYVLMIHG